MIKKILFYFLCFYAVAFYGQENAETFLRNKQSIKFRTRNSSVLKQNPSVNATTTTGCPTSIALLAQDSATATTIASGGTVFCNSKPFYLMADEPNTTPIDSINDIYTPCVEAIFNPYQSSLTNYGTLTIYDGGVDLECVGTNTTSCQFKIGAPNFLAGDWTLFISYLRYTQPHSFVFSTTAAITTTTVTLKSCWTNQVFNTFVWSASAASSQTVSLPATTNIGKSIFTITPSVTATALTDIHNGYCKIKPSQLSVGTYTVTNYFADSICGGALANYVFHVTQPNVTWSVPSLCVGGACVTLNSQLSSLAEKGGTWSGTGVSSGVFCPSTTGSYNAIYTTGTGTCSASQTHAIVVNPLPNITVNSATVCAGIAANLAASGASIYNWSPASSLSNSTGNLVAATPTVTTAYTVVGTSSSNCSKAATSVVTVNALPVASFSANPQITIIQTPQINFTDLSSGAVINNWNWFFGDGSHSNQQNPSHTYSNIGIYPIKLIVTSTSGCKDSVTHSIEIDAGTATIHNAFSPNNDGLNDLFEIDNINEFPNNHVYIYNRWGQLIWDKTKYDNINIVWDGKTSDGVVLYAGTYFYLVEIAGQQNMKGWVEITSTNK